MKVSEVRQLVRQAMEKQTRTVAALSGSTNPQSIEIAMKAKARAEAYEAVLLALNGEMSLLRVDAKEY